MISAISMEAAFASLARSVFLGGPLRDGLSDEMLVQLARRAIHVMAPCSAYQLRRALVEPLSRSCDADGVLAERVDGIVETLTVYGDILEMRDGREDSLTRGNVILRPAPPTFVRRRNGSFAVLGVAGDQITPLTEELEARIARGIVRTIEPLPGERLDVVFRELGLVELPERSWLRVPGIESASTHLAFWREQLIGQPKSSPIDGLRILDSANGASFYKGRWRPPDKRLSGLFVGRRPQSYGTDLWCVVELENGLCSRFLDLTVPGDRIRPCDVAWRIQAALDAVAGTPQTYRCKRGRDNATLSFNSPLPSWCERHLAIVGQRTKADGCLFAVELPDADLAGEATVLRETLWMTERPA
jgi:hypothetical protein